MHAVSQGTLDAHEFRSRFDEVLPGQFAWRAISRALCGRCFVSIDDVYMGLAPPTAREGDIVVVLYGGNVPYIMRRAEDKDYMLRDEISGGDALKAWQFVGEAYVHGLMDGQALDIENVSDAVFHIV